MATNNPPSDPAAIQVAPLTGDGNDDFDDVHVDSASLSSSILDYRAIQGRTYHSARHATDYFTPNDEQQQESVDLTHHYFTVLLDGKLHLAPVGEDVKTVLDVGTGTGIWAIDFADTHPHTHVTATDLSPIQPSWIPPNLTFEIEDATTPWSFPADSFQFIHMRYLFGGISNWDHLYEQAYRCCAPDGWLQSCELDAALLSDDGTAEGNWAIGKWNELFEEGGKRIGNSFTVVVDDLQRRGVEKAGFGEVGVVDYKLPMGGWALDPKLKEVGKIALTALLNDIQGYTMMLWRNVLEWPEQEYERFLVELRHAMKSRAIHSYMKVRFVYGRKPAE
ncbi:S-adenosyl-L-methionine-dependent methyltransferase [Podospora aff. communis PSN243]|uniref:S-adenosyl-L-methionine-dependent methyltransferase n=1 Tax=Podospora aff. communis PSN243 TaxID=3040156 RepID=A0AAV9G6P8_9PEZI|nr:S-adenosyl-L-methionine-dependent methyltransferase [Podospora aff. communis PSN243]